MSITDESSASQIAPAQVTESMGNLSINGVPDTADADTNGVTTHYNPVFGHAPLTGQLDGSAHNPVTDHPSVGPPSIVQGIIRPVDFRGNLIPLFVPVAGFAYITRLDDFHFGILDPDTGKTLSIHAATLKAFISFAYKAVSIPEIPAQPLFEPLGYREFVSLLHRDPVQPNRLTVLDVSGQVISPPSTALFPIRVDFPNDKYLEEALNVRRSFGGPKRVTQVNDIILNSASNNSRNRHNDGKGKRKGKSHNKDFGNFFLTLP
ncbi:hypothetical protein NLJ89_g3979 [Agrocybe chaxingu]|uniref:Uncharacterized protein n=1 Tax=Agrocybe chaxingu TaxID=84603 RepID=A0A9W8MUZ4_9AGAR|nr:hypothetical protein NLJ89_g3979 [Agrocybe chaxingu]